MSQKKEFPYADILNQPHHVSATRPAMPILDRAAQFAPFAALTGHGAAIREMARLTTQKKELDENAKSTLDHKIQILLEHFAQQPVVAITYFIPDSDKSGGAYHTITGSIRKVHSFSHTLIMEDGTVIPIEDITDLDSELFQTLVY